MTNKELNRDIKRLANRYKKLIADNNYTEHEQEIKAEALRLYRSDLNLEYMNVESLRIMVILNRKIRYEPFHLFGPANL